MLQQFKTVFFVHCYYPQIAQIFTDYYHALFLICVHLRNLRINILSSFMDRSWDAADGCAVVIVVLSFFRLRPVVIDR